MTISTTALEAVNDPPLRRYSPKARSSTRAGCRTNRPRPVPRSGVCRAERRRTAAAIAALLLPPLMLVLAVVVMVQEFPRVLFVFGLLLIATGRPLVRPSSQRALPEPWAWRLGFSRSRQR